MFWQAVWFVVNILFVVAMITTLFVHQALSKAKLEGEKSKVKRVTTQRNTLALLSALLFIGMCFAFLTNMRVNG